MKRYGYDPYHGRSRGRAALKVVIGVLLVLLVLSVAALFFLEPYVRYSSDGVRLELPFFRNGGEPEPPAESIPLRISTPSPTPTPEPEPDFRGLELPLSALTGGTAQEQIGAGGGTAAIFSMKQADGALAYQSESELGPSSEEAGINEAVRAANGDGLYTVARVSCFRDNALPWNDRALGIHSSAGNWRDDEGVRWSSPAAEPVRAYVVQVCGELAGLGFDELLLEHCGYPTRGETDRIAADGNYDPAALTGTMETFFLALDRTMERYPEVKVSVVTSLAVLGGGSDGSGLTLDLLTRYADKVYVRAPEGETVPTVEGLEIVPIVSQGADTGSWAVLS